MRKDDPETRRTRATAKEVAREVGVDVSAVYQALSGRGRLSEERRGQILAAAERLGYEADPLAKRLRSGRSDVDVPIFTYYFDRGVLTATLSSLQRRLSDAGYVVPLQAYHRGSLTQSAIIRRMRQERPRAIVFGESSFDDASLAEIAAFQAEGGVVVTYSAECVVECDQVRFSEAENTYLAVRHLAEQGHRKIGFSAQGPFDFSHERVQGLLQALEEAGLPFYRRFMFEGGMYEDGGMRTAEAFLAMDDRPTGVAIVNDISAVTFMNEVMRRGVRVPDDVSVVGHDDLPEGRHATVRLTTVRRPTEEIAANVCRFLVERVEGTFQGPPRTLEVHGELLVRESVAPPRP